jgi:hypothetical protein
MSNNNHLDSHTQEPETSWNIPHFCKVTAMFSGAIVFILTISHFKEAQKET